MPELVADKLLVEAAIAGDVAAVEHLLLVYYTPLKQHDDQKLPERARRHFESEDILQLVFSQVFRGITHFQPRGDGSFFAWLRTIADNRLVDALRKIDHGGAQRLSLTNLGDTS